MKYAAAIITVVYAHDESVSMGQAAKRIAEAAMRGDVLAVQVDELAGMTEEQAFEITGSCGECESCASFKVRSATADADYRQATGEAGADAIEAEDAAIIRAQQHTI